MSPESSENLPGRGRALKFFRRGPIVEYAKGNSRAKRDPHMDVNMTIANYGSTALRSRGRGAVQSLALPLVAPESTVEPAPWEARETTTATLAEGANGAQPAAKTTPRRPFTPAAWPLWEAIPPATRERILDNVWCGHCRAARRIANFIGVAQKGHARLQGFCSACGCVVARVIE